MTAQLVRSNNVGRREEDEFHEDSFDVCLVYVRLERDSHATLFRTIRRTKEIGPLAETDAGVGG